MRLSRDKVNKLAAIVTESLANAKDVDFLEPYDDVRQALRGVLEDLLKHEEEIDKAARQKIESQRRIITEGTQEWDILYRKYYNEEVKKLGI
jgi:uncharacterized protein